ncbi:hypothetical protein N7447_010385 [Penicillium robsamsonii]|uniref:uncharacterized protein n=1 Tax=Penicillium robsamsonii TaxID=1792511 RepID=UPI00254859D8|nr:uncharacterized protein N7447_010385 [Penicillium robsamsonii]KAJ5810869.1 hypothetical protein N7447_010385 [Penicillium robsamsonii]
MQQLNMMSTIYGCATVTIIALTGEHANAGLPGISFPRLTQVKESIEGYTFFTSPQDISLEIEVAPWSSRAWTMQERLLSRRSLTFTNSRVAFDCLDATCDEELDISTLPKERPITHPGLEMIGQLYRTDLVRMSRRSLSMTAH